MDKDERIFLLEMVPILAIRRESGEVRRIMEGGKRLWVVAE